MSDALRRIAEQFRLLPQHFTRDVHPQPERAMMMQADAAGRLLAEAMEKGAWEWSEILADAKENADSSGSDRYAAFWYLARQDWLPAMSRTTNTIVGTDSPPPDYAFSNECRVVADLIEREAADEAHPVLDPAPGHKRRGRLAKDESEAKRATLMAILGQHPSMKDDIKALVKQVGAGDKAIRRWLDEAEQKYRASAAATPTRSPEE